MYQALSDDKKNAFVSKFFASGGSKSKDYQWVNTYTEQVVNTDSSSSSHREGMFNRTMLIVVLFVFDVARCTMHLWLVSLHLNMCFMLLLSCQASGAHCISLSPKD